jgi:hypothetical protein
VEWVSTLFYMRTVGHTKSSSLGTRLIE